MNRIKMPIYIYVLSYSEGIVLHIIIVIHCIFVKIEYVNNINSIGMT